MVDQTAHKTITASQFKQMPESNQPIQLIHGEVIMSPSPSRSHQLIAGELYSYLKSIVTEGEFLIAPMDIYLDEMNVIQPDVMWIGPNSHCTLIDDYWHGPPDLIIEVLSPGTALRDKRTKFHLYEAHGVREYWIVDTSARLVEVWVLSNENFVRQDVYGNDHEFESAILGDKTIPLKQIFAVLD